MGSVQQLGTIIETFRQGLVQSSVFVYKAEQFDSMSHNFWGLDFYKGVDNDKEILILLKEYEMGTIVQDVEHFTAMRHDMVDEHPNVQNLEMVLDRILEYILKT